MSPEVGNAADDGGSSGFCRLGDDFYEFHFCNGRPKIMGTTVAYSHIVLLLYFGP